MTLELGARTRRRGVEPVGFVCFLTHNLFFVAFIFKSLQMIRNGTETKRMHQITYLALKMNTKIK